MWNSNRIFYAIHFLISCFGQQLWYAKLYFYNSVSVYIWLFGHNWHIMFVPTWSGPYMYAFFSPQFFPGENTIVAKTESALGLLLMISIHRPTWLALSKLKGVFFYMMKKKIELSLKFSFVFSNIWVKTNYDLQWTFDWKSWFAFFFTSGKNKLFSFLIIIFCIKKWW